MASTNVNNYYIESFFNLKIAFTICAQSIVLMIKILYHVFTCESKFSDIT